MAQMHQHFTDLQINLFKFAAACSLFQQANDAGRLYMLLKRVFGSYDYVSATEWPMKEVAATAMSFLFLSRKRILMIKNTL